ncbi:MAG: hypothetical protein HY720_00590 [Planctomycetes bacterium]|nr:hypothetical protein [Planctomycetota bacterium]
MGREQRHDPAAALIRGRVAALLLALWAATAVSAQGGDGLEEEDALRLQFERLSFYLESGDELERERAVASLVEMGRSILPWLETKMAGKPPEVVERWLRVKAELSRDEFEGATPGSQEDPAANEGFLEAYFRGRFEQARELFRQGQFERSNEIVSAILALEPALPFREELLALQADLRSRLVFAGSISPRARPDREFYSWGDPVVLDLVIENVGQGDFALAAEHEVNGETSRSAVHVSVEILQYDLSGASRKKRVDLSAPIERDVRIRPGERWSGSVEFDPLPLKESRLIAATVRLQARLVVVRVLEGGPVSPSGIPFLPVTVTVLPSDHAKLAADPEASLLGAIEKEERVHAFLASFLVPRGRLPLLVGGMIERLEGEDSEMREVLCGILARWTGERGLGTSPDNWRQWWAARKESWLPPRED